MMPGHCASPACFTALGSLQLYASGFAAVAMGIARGALDAFIELARDQHGAPSLPPGYTRDGPFPLSPGMTWGT